VRSRSFDSGTLSDANYIKTSMTVLSRDQGTLLQVTSFNYNGFVINNNIRIIGAMVIFPKTVFSWNVAGLEDVNETSLSVFRLLEPRPG
jgi:hypothetical protein